MQDTGWERVSLLVTERFAGRLPSDAHVSGRSLKCGFVDRVVACELDASAPEL